jgi:AraC-like DNA-binding protein
MKISHLHVENQNYQSAHLWMKDICGEHSLQTSSPQKVSFTHSGYRLGPSVTTLGKIKYGVDVTIGIDPSNTISCYSLSLPMTGQQILRVDNHTHVSERKKALILSPGIYQEIDISGNCSKIQIAIPKQAMHYTLQKMLQQPLDEPLLFTSIIDLNHSKNDAWWRMVQFYFREIELHQEFYVLPSISENLEKTLIKSLLLSHEHNYSEILKDIYQAKIPTYLINCRDFIENYAREKICLQDLVNYCGLSSNFLNASFKKYYRKTPMQYLKKFRLEKVRQQLIHDGNHSNISTIAMDWGLTHMGRFSHEYYNEFKEYPSETIKHTKLINML